MERGVTQSIARRLPRTRARARGHHRTIPLRLPSCLLPQRLLLMAGTLSAALRSTCSCVVAILGLLPLLGQDMSALLLDMVAHMLVLRRTRLLLLGMEVPIRVLRLVMAIMQEIEGIVLRMSWRLGRESMGLVFRAGVRILRWELEGWLG